MLEKMKLGGIDMKRLRKWIAVLLINAMVVGIMGLCVRGEVYAANVPSILYRAHIEDAGWQKYVRDGNVAGSYGRGKRMEALQINLTSRNRSMIKYRVHIQGAGWQSWVGSGGLAGSVGQAKRIEAVQIRLMGTYAKKYDIYYRAHISQAGWMGWAKNGITAGSEGYSMQLEAVQIRLVSKGTVINDNTQPYAKMPALVYNGHVANIGWRGWVNNGKIAGTTNEARRLEAFVINLQNFHKNSGIRYVAHVSKEGWQNWVSSGQVSGTTGKSQAIEAVRIELTGYMDKFYDIYYRLHVKDHGWLGWAKNGEVAGTTGGGTRAEALQIKLVVKGSSFDRGGNAYIDKTVKESSKEEGAKSNPYPATQDVDRDGLYEVPCTRVAWQQVYDNSGISLPGWGNAGEWLNNAKRSGYGTGTTPKAGAIAVWSGDYYGHVAYVVSASGNTLVLNEGGRTDLDQTSSHGIAYGYQLTNAVGERRAYDSGKTLIGFIYPND